jgi:hypothetical protein
MQRPHMVLSLFVSILCLATLTAARNNRRTGQEPLVLATPQEPVSAPEIGGSMFQTAAAGTTALAWYQFDLPGGGADPQGWTAHDATAVPEVYFHVDGPGCNGVSAINGAKSMWCGQWATSEDPWCGWATLPGYGNRWNQRLEASVSATSVSYTIEWDSEPGYDYTYLEWWEPVNGKWVRDTGVNGGFGRYDGVGGPLTEVRTSPYGPTSVRFLFASDGAFSDEDGLFSSVEGGVKIDDVSINGGPVEDFEGAACGAQNQGVWTASAASGYGLYANLYFAGSLLQEDPCSRYLSTVWGFFDDPASTNYACGGWPLVGAVPYGPDDNGLYMDNEIWSPWIPITGTGDEFLLEFLVYRDLPLDNLVFYTWKIRTRDNDTGGCPSRWKTDNNVYNGNAQPDWKRERFSVGNFVAAGDDEIQIALGAVDGCGFFCGYLGTGNCHSHAPLFDQVKVLRVNQAGPEWTVKDFYLWQDNFPETGGVGPTDYARCDMALNQCSDQFAGGIVPGDSLLVRVADPNGLADDNTGGRPRKAVYAFVRVTDRFGNPVAGKNGLALQSPDNIAYIPFGSGTDPYAGLLRWPFVSGVAPAGWDAYRMDFVQLNGSTGTPLADQYCVDLMDLSAGPHSGPSKHGNEAHAANTGIFAPGDVIHYFLGARNTLGMWSYWHRTLDGQGAGVQTNDIAEAMASPCEWSVLPDAGRAPGDLGDILFVDDADDRGGPAQAYFDMAFKVLGIEDRVDRFDVLGPISSGVSNGLASRVKNFRTQLIGDSIEAYQKILWNCSDRSFALMGDGGEKMGGIGNDKSNDFALCDSFLTNHPDNPGWAYWGDDVVQNWATLAGASASVKSKYMNHTLVGGNQSAVTGKLSPVISSVSATPWDPESFYPVGGCPALSNFDMPGATGASSVSHRYDGQANAPAALYQETANTAGSTARFFLAGFGFNFIRDDVVSGVPDYAVHLHATLLWMNNVLPAPTGIDPVAFANSLDDNYPNPFNPTTTLRYGIAERGCVTLKIYNAAGQLVRTLVDEEQVPQQGGFSKIWNGMNERGEPVASGVYFYQLTAKNFSQTKKMVLLK